MTMFSLLGKFLKRQPKEEGNFTPWIKVGGRVSRLVERDGEKVFLRFDVYERKNRDTGKYHQKAIECKPLSDAEKIRFGYIFDK